MSTPSPDTFETERDLRAAEIALGLATADPNELSRDPALAAAVAEWQERTAGFADGLAATPPPPRIWANIDAAVEREVTPFWVRAWRSVALWRAGTGFGLAATAALAAIIWLRAPSAPPDTPVREVLRERVILVAPLSGPDGPPLFVAMYDGPRQVLVMVTAAASLQTRPVQLWLVPEGDDEPVEIGLVRPGDPVSLPVSAELAGRITHRASFVLTQQPTPTAARAGERGPVIAHGTFAAF